MSDEPISLAGKLPEGLGEAIEAYHAMPLERQADVVRELSGEYIEPRPKPRHNLPATVVREAELMIAEGEVIDGEYASAPRGDVSDTELVNRLVAVMPTINLDQQFRAKQIGYMIVSLTAPWDELHWLRQQLLRRQAEQRSENAIVEVKEPPPMVDPKSPGFYS